MAKFALGMGTSHVLMKDPGYWLRRGDTAEEFLRNHCGLDPTQIPLKPELQPQLSQERCEEQFQQSNAAVKALGDALQEADVDALLVVTNQHGAPKVGFQPVFGIYVGESLTIGEMPTNNEAAGRAAGAPLPAWATQSHPAHPALARHLLDSLIEDGFDVACMKGYREGTGLGHEHTLLYEDFLRKQTPVIPFEVSRYLPYQATSARCYALGRALRRAIETWDTDERVAVLASGGLSHQLVDEELDRAVVAALLGKDRDYLSGLPRDRLNVLPGTAEILNWVTLAGLAEDREMTLLGYVPSYWSLYGTGHGFCFAYWQ